MKGDYNRQQWILTQWQQHELDREIVHLQGMLQALGTGSWLTTKSGHTELGTGNITLLEAFDIGLVFGKQMYRVKQANWTNHPIGELPTKTVPKTPSTLRQMFDRACEIIDNNLCNLNDLAMSPAILEDVENLQLAYRQLAITVEQMDDKEDADINKSLAEPEKGQGD